MTVEVSHAGYKSRSKTAATPANLRCPVGRLQWNAINKFQRGFLVCLQRDFLSEHHITSDQIS
jgi:hypothetical protein